MVCLLLCVFMSCRKNSTIEETKIGDDTALKQQAIATAKTYFKNSLEPQPVSTEGLVTLYGNRTPVWEQAVVFRYNGTETVVVPLKYEKDLSLNYGWNGSSSYRLKDYSNLQITLGDKPKAIVETSVPGANLKGTSLNVAEYIITEDWAGNIIDKVIITKDKGLFRFSTTQNIKSDRVRTNSSQCIYIEWSICDYKNGMTFNCEFIGTTTIGCNEELEPPGDGGGENIGRISMRFMTADPAIPGNDSTKVRGAIHFEAQGGLFTVANWLDSKPYYIESSWSYVETGHTANYVNVPTRIANAGFTGTIYVSSTETYTVGILRTFTYDQAFMP